MDKTKKTSLIILLFKCRVVSLYLRSFSGSIAYIRDTSIINGSLQSWQPVILIVRYGYIPLNLLAINLWHD